MEKDKAEDLATAIQRVLAQYDVTDARVVLEVFDNRNDSAGAAVAETGSSQKSSPKSNAATTNVSTVIANATTKVELAPAQSSPASTTTTAAANAVPSPLRHTATNRVEVVVKPSSPTPPLPPSRSSFSSSYEPPTMSTTTAPHGHVEAPQHTPAPPPPPPSVASTDGSGEPHTTGGNLRFRHLTTAPAHPAPSKELTTTPPSAVDASKEDARRGSGQQQAAPASLLVSPTNGEGEESTPLSKAELLRSATATLQKLSAVNGEGGDAGQGAMYDELSQRVMVELMQRQKDAERRRILNSFVGKSVLLDDKRAREQKQSQAGGSSRIPSSQFAMAANRAKAALAAGSTPPPSAAATATAGAMKPLQPQGSTTAAPSGTITPPNTSEGKRDGDGKGRAGGNVSSEQGLTADAAPSPSPLSPSQPPVVAQPRTPSVRLLDDRGSGGAGATGGSGGGHTGKGPVTRLTPVFSILNKESTLLTPSSAAAAAATGGEGASVSPDSTGSRRHHSRDHTPRAPRPLSASSNTSSSRPAGGTGGAPTVTSILSPPHPAPITRHQPNGCVEIDEGDQGTTTVAPPSLARPPSILVSSGRVTPDARAGGSTGCGGAGGFSAAATAASAGNAACGAEGQPDALPPIPQSALNGGATVSSTTLPSRTTPSPRPEESRTAQSEKTAQTLTSLYAASSGSASAARRPSLREMLAEQQSQRQQQQQQGSVRDLKQPTAGGALPTSSSPISSSSSLRLSSPPVGKDHKGQPTTSPTVPAHVSASTTSSMSTPAGSAIQVVRFTMPAEQRAKSEVVAQLSRSSAGQQHISNKDKYSAMLKEQQADFTRTAAAEKEYQELVERAVEVTRQLHTPQQ